MRPISGAASGILRAPTFVLVSIVALTVAAPAAAQGTVYVRSADFEDPDGLWSARNAVELGTADTIVLDTSVHDARPLRFTVPVQIIGNGHTIHMDAVDGTLLSFDVSSLSQQVSLRDLVLEGACDAGEDCGTSQQGIAASETTALSLEGVRVTAFSGTVFGAGLRCAGWCELLECDFDHNHAIPDSEIRGVGLGGAIGVGLELSERVHPVRPPGYLLVERSHLYENSAFAGGAIFSYAADVEIERSAMDANRAYQGGALFLKPMNDENSQGTFGSLRVGSSTLHSNAATEGGHIYVHNPVLFVVESSTLTAGSATYGQSIFAPHAHAYLANSIIDGDAGACEMSSARVTSCGLLTDPRAACSTHDPQDPSLACGDHQASYFDLEPYAPITLAVPRSGPVGPMMGRRPRLESPAFGAAEPSLPAPWRSYGFDQAGYSRTSGAFGPDIGALER